VATSVLLAVFVCHRVPSGHGSARLYHLYGDNEQHRRWALGNIVPEVDQLLLIFSVMPLVDPLFTYRQAAPLKVWTRKIYRELNADADFHAVGSVMPLAYADLRGGDVPQHAFLYVPKTLDRSRPAGALVFFHGSGGNFKAYVRLLSKIADELNVVVIAPSFGSGRWTARETHERTSAALTAAQRIVPVDRTQVHAIGLSNGGLAVSHLLREAPHDYRSFVFLSPIFHLDSLRRPPSIASGSLPVFIATGDFDNRVPLSYVGDAVRRMTNSGAAVTLEVIHDANHFAIFSHRDQVLAKLQRWLHQQGHAPSDMPP
jgi:predicted esterase